MTSYRKTIGRTAELLDQPDDDARGRDVAVPVDVLVVRCLSHEFGAVGAQAVEDVVDDVDDERETRMPHEPDTTRAVPSPSSSPNSGADANEPRRLRERAREASADRDLREVIVLVRYSGLSFWSL